ncbi:MAG: hypothetical protein ACM3XS_09235 [Bacteroidota bacterium]
MNQSYGMPGYGAGPFVPVPAQQPPEAPAPFPPNAAEPLPAPGLAGLVGLILRNAEEIGGLAARASDQGGDVRQALRQIQQLAGQSRAYAYQMRGMLLQ